MENISIWTQAGICLVHSLQVWDVSAFIYFLFYAFIYISFFAEHPSWVGEHRLDLEPEQKVHGWMLKCKNPTSELVLAVLLVHKCWSWIIGWKRDTQAGVSASVEQHSQAAADRNRQSATAIKHSRFFQFFPWSYSSATVQKRAWRSSQPTSLESDSSIIAEEFSLGTGFRKSSRISPACLPTCPTVSLPAAGCCVGGKAWMGQAKWKSCRAGVAEPDKCFSLPGSRALIHDVCSDVMIWPLCRWMDRREDFSPDSPDQWMGMNWSDVVNVSNSQGTESWRNRKVWEFNFFGGERKFSEVLVGTTVVMWRDGSRSLESFWSVPFCHQLYPVSVYPDPESVFLEISSKFWLVCQDYRSMESSWNVFCHQLYPVSIYPTLECFS